jgi:hypothetical protein
MLAVARASSKEKSAASDVAILFFTYQTGTIAHNFWRHPSKVSLVRKSIAAPHSYRTMSETGRNLSYRLYTRASAIGGLRSLERPSHPAGIAQKWPLRARFQYVHGISHSTTSEGGRDCEATGRHGGGCTIQNLRHGWTRTSFTRRRHLSRIGGAY